MQRFAFRSTVVLAQSSAEDSVFSKEIFVLCPYSIVLLSIEVCTSHCMYIRIVCTTVFVIIVVTG